MRISVCIDTGRPWSEVATIAHQLDATACSCIYVCDHFIRADSLGRTIDGGVVEAWTALAALAATTTRVKLGTLVLGSAYRHPAVVANMAATLDQISAGRAVLGLGAGWQVNEHTAYGMDLLPPAARVERFAEACSIIVSLLTEPRTTFAGRWYQIVDARCEPKPIQASLPLLVGGAGTRTMAVAARFAAVWHAWGTVDDLRQKNVELDRICMEIGRDPRTLDRASGGPRLGAARSEVADAVRAYAEAGVDELIWRDEAATPISKVLEQLHELPID